jgi:membrane protein
VAFYAMLAIFPAVAGVIALWGFVSDPELVAEQLALLQSVIPASAFDLLQAQVAALVRANDSTLGWATVISTGAALWSTRSGIAALIRGLNVIYGVQPRGGVWAQVTALMMTAALVGVALLALFGVVVTPLVLAFFPLGGLAEAALLAVRWTLTAGIVFLGLGLVYRYGPNLKRRRPHWISVGSIVALVIWAAASLALSAYLSNFGSYNRIYGSIGAVIALLMWFFISAYALLLGAAVNAELVKEKLGLQQDGAGA